MANAAKYYGTGRRKSSIARVYLVPGNGKRHGFKGRGDTFFPYSDRQRADTGM